MNILVVVVIVVVALLLFALCNHDARAAFGLGRPREAAAYAAYVHPPVPERSYERPPSSDAQAVSEHRVQVEFLPSPGWSGSRPGYVFRTGDLGLGYYLDKKVDFSTAEILEFDSSESPESVRGSPKSINPLVP